MLQVVEDLDIRIIRAAVKRQKLRQSVLIIIFIGKFQNRFPGLLTEPHQRTAYQFVGPCAGGHQPWVDNPGQFGGCCEVEHHMGIVVCLQERCRYRVGDLLFHRLLDDVCLLLTPCCQEDLAGFQDGAYSHGDRAWWHDLVGAEAHGHLLSRHIVYQDDSRGRCHTRARFIGCDVSHTSDTE